MQGAVLTTERNLRIYKFNGIGRPPPADDFPADVGKYKLLYHRCYILYRRFRSYITASQYFWL